MTAKKTTAPATQPEAPAQPKTVEIQITTTRRPWLNGEPHTLNSHVTTDPETAARLEDLGFARILD